MSNVIIRPATHGDFLEMGIDVFPHRSRAIAGERDGKLIGVGGLTYLPDGTVAAFASLTDSARRVPLALHKAGKRLMCEARRLGIRRVVALADCNIAAAERWLCRLGFEPVHVSGATAWVWFDG